MLTNPYDVLYASGYNSMLERKWLQEPVSGVIVPADPAKPVILVIPEALITLLATMADQGTPDRADEIRPFELLNFFEVGRAADPHYRPEAIAEAAMKIHGERVTAESQPDLIAALRLALRDYGLDRGTVAFDDLRVVRYLTNGADALRFHVEDALEMMIRARVVKTVPELEAFRHIGPKADYAVHEAARRLRPGITWDEFQAEVADLIWWSVVTLRSPPPPPAP